jgi:hypothetical protein
MEFNGIEIESYLTGRYQRVIVGNGIDSDDGGQNGK